ncbi:4-nitrophenylphosphatase [Malassezia vespertilionis]|uniref:4-nitrophenylphosphatase n=1 Tax=Malassezia vespertilionis TaxID=2020962 RepID=UPI0024B11344|nr:4-nitrophenylphosphatase [Malassezia vespertilionis]WFD06827.1 4-nitrophenylphosphatase [Malassezia vespertilionis]
MGNVEQVPNGAFKLLDSVNDYEALVARYDNFLFVLWSGPDVLPGVLDVLSKLRARGKRILFVTNNASKSRRMLLNRFQKVGIEATEDEVFSSAYASAVYLKQVLKFPTDRKVFVIGMSGIEEELDCVGVQHIGGSQPCDVSVQGVDFSALLQQDVFDDSVAAVLCGIDTQLSYVKMALAFRYITRADATEPVKSGMQGGGCHFLCTNGDVTFPSNDGFWPGAGACWAGLRDASKREPVVVGKPHQPMIDTIFASHRDFDRARTIMVGDRLDTDIKFGANGGLDTLLVLTGVTTMSAVTAQDAPAVPTYVVQSLGDMDVLP